MSKIMQLSSHEYYHGLNRRFDKRVERLQHLGFKYDKQAPGMRNGPFERHLLTNTFIMHADRRAWTDRLRMHLS